MLDLLTLARLNEFCGCGQRKCRRRDEDAFYREFADPPALLVAFGRALSFGTWRARKGAASLLLADEEAAAVRSA